MFFLVQLAAWWHTDTDTRKHCNTVALGFQVGCGVLTASHVTNDWAVLCVTFSGVKKSDLPLRYQKVTDGSWVVVGFFHPTISPSWFLCTEETWKSKTAFNNDQQETERTCFFSRSFFRMDSGSDFLRKARVSWGNKGKAIKTRIPRASCQQVSVWLAMKLLLSMFLWVVHSLPMFFHLFPPFVEVKAWRRHCGLRMLQQRCCQGVVGTWHIFLRSQSHVLSALLRGLKWPHTLLTCGFFASWDFAI